MDKKPAGKKGMARLGAAFIYSLNGLRFAITHETAFIQEACVYVILLVILFFLPLSLTFKCILLLANTAVLIVELVNSAIESVVDIISPEYSVLARQAKDLGSAAVLMSIVIAIALWICAAALMLKGG